MRFEIIEQARVGVDLLEPESQNRACDNDGRRKNRKRSRPKSMRWFSLDNFAFARNCPAQKRWIHHVGTNESDNGTEHTAEAELTKRFGFNNQQTGEAERSTDHRPERRRESHSQ